MISFYSMVRHRPCCSGPQLHFFFLYILMQRLCSPAREVNICQWAPHELQAVCTQDLGSVELLQTDRSRDIFPRSVYRCPCCLSLRGCLLAWKQGQASTGAIFTSWLLWPRKMKTPSSDRVTLVNIWVPEREWEKSDGECVHISKKIAHFQVPSHLQRTRVITKELVQDGVGQQIREAWTAKGKIRRKKIEIRITLGVDKIKYE